MVVCGSGVLHERLNLWGDKCTSVCGKKDLIRVSNTRVVDKAMVNTLSES